MGLWHLELLFPYLLLSPWTQLIHWIMLCPLLILIFIFLQRYDNKSHHVIITRWITHKTYMKHTFLFLLRLNNPYSWPKKIVNPCGQSKLWAKLRWRCPYLEEHVSPVSLRRVHHNLRNVTPNLRVRMCLVQISLLVVTFPPHTSHVLTLK